MVSAWGIRPFGTFGSSQPRQPYDLDSAKVRILMRLAKGGADDATLLDYLRVLQDADRKKLEAEFARVKVALEVEIEHLKGALETAKARSDTVVATLTSQLDNTTLDLKHTTAQYLRVRGLLHMRGVMDYHQEMMGKEWDQGKASTSWARHITKVDKLKRCLEKHKLDSESGGALMARMYQQLSEENAGSSPAQQLLAGGKVAIGPPLDREGRNAMACLCELAKVDYKML